LRRTKPRVRTRWPSDVTRGHAAPETEIRFRAVGTARLLSASANIITASVADVATVAVESLLSLEAAMWLATIVVGRKTSARRPKSGDDMGGINTGDHFNGSGTALSQVRDCASACPDNNFRRK